MLYKTIEMRFHEDYDATKNVVLNLAQPASFDEIVSKVEKVVGRSVEEHRIKMVLKDLSREKRITENDGKYKPTSPSLTR